MLEELRVIQGNKEKFGHLVFNKRIFVPEDAVYIGRGSKWGISGHTYLVVLPLTK